MVSRVPVFLRDALDGSSWRRVEVEVLCSTGAVCTLGDVARAVQETAHSDKKPFRLFVAPKSSPAPASLQPAQEDCLYSSLEDVFVVTEGPQTPGMPEVSTPPSSPLASKPCPSTPPRSSSVPTDGCLFGVYVTVRKVGTRGVYSWQQVTVQVCGTKCRDIRAAVATLFKAALTQVQVFVPDLETLKLRTPPEDMHLRGHTVYAMVEATGVGSGGSGSGVGVGVGVGVGAGSEDDGSAGEEKHQELECSEVREKKRQRLAAVARNLSRGAQPLLVIFNLREPSQYVVFPYNPDVSCFEFRGSDLDESVARALRNVENKDTVVRILDGLTCLPVLTVHTCFVALLDPVGQVPTSVPDVVVYKNKTYTLHVKGGLIERVWVNLAHLLSPEFSHMSELEALISVAAGCSSSVGDVMNKLCLHMRPLVLSVMKRQKQDPHRCLFP